MNSQVLFVLSILVAMLAIQSGCLDSEPAESQIHVWGRRGISDGRFQKPRAAAVDDDEHLCIVDMTGRIQIFDENAEFVRSWRTPKVKMGKPCGLSISRDGLLMVADTHYHRILFYDLEGNLIEERTIGGTLGMAPGEFGYVTDVVQDSRGNYYVSEYGEFDRIQKFSPDGNFLMQWGGRGSDEGQFLRPQGLAIDEQDRIWVADASNHRIQVFDVTGDTAIHLFSWGTAGRNSGELRYPYDVALVEDYVYVCEFGNHRIQRFTRDGTPSGTWGQPGREPGQLHQPWAIAVDGNDKMHVLDSYNHRVQTLDLRNWDHHAQSDNANLRE